MVEYKNNKIEVKDIFMFSSKENNFLNEKSFIKKCIIKNNMIEGIIYDNVYDATYINNNKWFILDIKSGAYTFGKIFSSNELLFINEIEEIIDEL